MLPDRHRAFAQLLLGGALVRDLLPPRRAAPFANARADNRNPPAHHAVEVFIGFFSHGRGRFRLRRGRRGGVCLRLAGCGLEKRDQQKVEHPKLRNESVP